MTIAPERLEESSVTVAVAKALPDAWYVTGPLVKTSVPSDYFNTGVCLMPPDQRVAIIEAVTGRSDWPWMADAECIMAGGNRDEGYFVYFMRRRPSLNGDSY